METAIVGWVVTVTCAVAVLVGSAAEVTTTWKTPVVDGAVYWPVPSTVPPPASTTVHVTETVGGARDGGREGNHARSAPCSPTRAGHSPRRRWRPSGHWPARRRIRTPGMRSRRVPGVRKQAHVGKDSSNECGHERPQGLASERALAGSVPSIGLRSGPAHGQGVARRPPARLRLQVERRRNRWPATAGFQMVALWTVSKFPCRKSDVAATSEAPEPFAPELVDADRVDVVRVVGRAEPGRAQHVADHVHPDVAARRTGARRRSGTGWPSIRTRPAGRTGSTRSCGSR